MTGEDKIKHKNPFRVPENYFEQVNSRILASTSREVKSREIYTEADSSCSCNCGCTGGARYAGSLFTRAFH